MVGIEKNKSIPRKTSAIGLSKCGKIKALSPLPFIRKNTITFCPVWAILWQETGRDHTFKSRHEILQPRKSWATQFKKMLFQHSFTAISTKGHFSVKFNPDFEVWLLLWLPCPQFWKKWDRFVSQCWTDCHQFKTPIIKTKKARMAFSNHPFSFWDQFN